MNKLWVLTAYLVLLGSTCSISSAQLINISTRGQVLTGDDVMIAGFIIGGATSQNVVVNVAGPSLMNYGIANPLTNPVITLIRSSDNVIIATNDDWQSQTNPADVVAIQATGFQPNNPLEPAVIATLPPGAYTAIVQGVNGSTGVGLVGAFAVLQQQPSLWEGGRALLEDSTGTIIGPLIDQDTVALTANGIRVALYISPNYPSFGARWNQNYPQSFWSATGCTGQRFLSSGDAVTGSRTMGVVINENGSWNLYLAVGEPVARPYLSTGPGPDGQPGSCSSNTAFTQPLMAVSAPIPLPYTPPFYIH